MFSSDNHVTELLTVQFGNSGIGINTCTKGKGTLLFLLQPCLGWYYDTLASAIVS